MRSVQLLDPHELGVYRITTSTHESWLTTAGNGLLISTKSAQGSTKATLLMLRLHLPTLQIEMVFSWIAPAHTSPKSVEPVTRMSPGGTLPRTETIFGDSGSLLVIRIVPVRDPKPPLGWKRIGTAIVS